jgi:ABC-type branched-subunit amino acid transport system ATPase component
MVLVAPNLELGMGGADRVVVLDRGRRSAHGTPEGVGRSPLVPEA